MVDGEEMLRLAVECAEDEIAGGFGVELEIRGVLVGGDAVLEELEAGDDDAGGDNREQDESECDAGEDFSHGRLRSSFARGDDTPQLARSRMKNFRLGST